MESVIVYCIKSCALLAIFYIAYNLALKKVTFFKTNRLFLLLGLFTATLLPLIVFTKIVWIYPVPQTNLQSIDVSQLLEQTPKPLNTSPYQNYWLYIMTGYGTGLLFFASRFSIDIYKVAKLLKSTNGMKAGRFTFIDSRTIQSPFSFFNYIVYNSAALHPQELKSIINHEKIHSSQLHSLDVIMAQLYCIAFWFNPIAWLYKKAIVQNLEFIADAGALSCTPDKVAYQKTLLKITLQPDYIAITNSFYQSLIKKRIIMINKQQSKKANSYKYALVVPVIAAFMVVFQVEVIAKEKDNGSSVILNPASNNVSTKISEKVAVTITARSTYDELEANANVLREAFDAKVLISNVERNNKKQIIAIKVDVSHKGESKKYEIIGTDPIYDFSIQLERNENGSVEINFITAKNHKMSTLVEKGTTDTIYMTGKSKKFDPNSDELKNVVYVIDGVKQKDGDGLSKIDPNEIESIDVLKNSDELIKKYGRKAKNGVILITTRKSLLKKGTGFVAPEPVKNTGSIIVPDYFDASRQAKPVYVVKTETRRIDNDSLVSFKLYTQYDDDPTIQKIESVNFTNKMSSYGDSKNNN